jgi:hypothetical protein
MKFPAFLSYYINFVAAVVVVVVVAAIVGVLSLTALSLLLHREKGRQSIYMSLTKNKTTEFNILAKRMERHLINKVRVYKT